MDHNSKPTEPEKPFPPAKPPPPTSKSPHLPRTTSQRKPDCAHLRPYLGSLPTKTVKNTIQNTTQLACLTTSALLKQAHKSPNPALNVMCPRKPVATDTLYSDAPAADCGVTQAQIFVGCNTDVVDICPLQTKKKFINTLKDDIRFQRAMSKLISNCSTCPRILTRPCNSCLEI